MRPRHVLAVVALVLVGAACTSDDPGASSTTAAPPSTLTTTSTTDAEPSTTSTEPVTTTTAPPSTTTTAATSTTTTTMPSTTTIGPVDPGDVVLTEGGVLVGSVEVEFGTDDDAAIAAISAALGPPTEDSGWIDAFSVYGTCPLPVVRGVHWGDLVGLFTEAATDFASAGTPHFFSWYYATGTDPDLATDTGISIGATVAQLQAAYPGPTFVLVPWEFDDTQGIWSTRQFDPEQLYGFTTGLGAADTVTAINGGTGCGE